MDPVAAEVLTEELQEPFTLRLLREVPEKDAEIVVAGLGGFAETGLNE